MIAKIDRFAVGNDEIHLRMGNADGFDGVLDGWISAKFMIEGSMALLGWQEIVQISIKTNFGTHVGLIHSTFKLFLNILGCLFRVYSSSYVGSTDIISLLIFPASTGLERFVQLTNSSISIYEFASGRDLFMASEEMKINA